MLNAKRPKHWKLSLGVALVMLVGLVLTACVPQDLTTNVAQTKSDVAALKTTIDGIKAKIDELDKGGQEPKSIERETKDQVIRGRADLLDYRMDYDAFKKSLDGKMTQILGTPAKKQQGKPDIPAKPGLVENQMKALQAALAGTPAKKGEQGKPDTPAKPGIVETELVKLRDTLAGIPAKKGAPGKPDVPGKPGLLPSRDDVQTLAKSLDDIKAQLDRIEKALAAPKP